MADKGVIPCHQSNLHYLFQSGVGRATAEDLARRNARVILACRNLDKAKRAAEEITSSTGNKEVIVVHLDLASFSSVRKCAQKVMETEDKLDVLINNAGIFGKYSMKFHVLPLSVS